MRRLLPLLLVFVAAWDPITSPDPDVDEGNKRYAAGRYDEAEARYREAERRLAGDPALHFDLGAALHRQGEAMPPGPARDAELDSAERELRLALDASDPRQRARVHYNLGNTLYRRGKLGDAIEEYKKSLKLDPGRDDARHNLELALRMVKEPPPQPQPQPQSQPQPPQPSPSSQPQPDEQQAPPQPQPQPGAQQPQPQPPKQGEDEQPQPQPQPEQDRPRPQPDENRQPPTDTTADDLERKLDALERDSNDMRAHRARAEASERRRGKDVKDW